MVPGPHRLHLLCVLKMSVDREEAVLQLAQDVLKVSKALFFAAVRPFLLLLLLLLLLLRGGGGGLHDLCCVFFSLLGRYWRLWNRRRLSCPVL